MGLKLAYYNIISRNGKYCCQIRWHAVDSQNRKSKNKTFHSKADAKTWGKTQVHMIEKKIAEGEEIYLSRQDIKTFGNLIETYLDDDMVDIGRSKRYSLQAAKDCDIGLVEIKHLRSRHFVDYCKDRKRSGTSPATIACDVSHMRSVLRSAKALYDIGISEKPVIDAMPTLHILKLVAKPNIRSRRPTDKELHKLREELAKREGHPCAAIPYCDILDFSIFSCMRIGEVCSILWEDLDRDEGWILVRDRKDPRKKVGNHMKVPLIGGALEIALRQKVTDDPRIFPFESRSITHGFREARNVLKIDDLRYHDLRREGASRLFEQGYDIAKVAQVTGHRDLNTLWRIYTDLLPSNFTTV